MIFIKRTKYEEIIKSFVNSNENLLLHFYGIAGTGKTQLIKNSETILSHKFLLQDYLQYKDLSVEVLIHKIKFNFLTNTEIGLYDKVVSKRIQSEIFFTASYNKKHILKVSGNLEVRGNLIIGDVHNYGEQDAKSKNDKKIEILTEELTNRLKAKNEAFIIVLDRIENATDDNVSIKWITNELLIRTNNVKLISLSRKINTIKVQTEKILSVEVKTLEYQEAKDLILSHNILEEEQIKLLIAISRLHPLSLILAILASKNLTPEISVNLETWNSLTQELIVNFLVKEILDNEEVPEFKNALLKLPLLRFFIPDTISKSLDIPVEKVPEIIFHLLAYGFIEETNGVYKFHDLLFELLNQYIAKYIGENEYLKLHYDVYKKYLNSDIPKGFEIMYLIEPLYHIFKFSPIKAQPYFEKICKPALDKKDKLLAAAIINEIDINVLPFCKEKGWYLLRFGGYYREFDEYEKALSLFNDALSYAKEDKCLVASIKNNIGWVYLYHNPKENNAKAIAAFKESNVICYENNFTNIIGMNLNNLGIAYDRKKNLKTAKQFYEASLQITESKRSYNPIVAAKSYRNLGLIYEEKKDFQNAIKYYNKAIEKNFESLDNQSIGENLFFISQLLFRNNLIDQSLNVCLQSQKYLKDKKYGHYLTENHLLLSEISMCLNDLKSLSASLYNFLVSSLNVSWSYHQFSVSRLIQILKFITINYGKEESKKTLVFINERWHSNIHLKEIPLPEFLINSFLPEVLNSDYWLYYNNSKYHILSSSCKAKNWKRLVLMQKGMYNNGLILCKKCDVNRKKHSHT